MRTRTIVEPATIDRQGIHAWCRQRQVPLAFVMVLTAQWYCIAMYVGRTVSWQERFPELFAGLTACWLIWLDDRDRTRQGLSPAVIVAPLLIVAATFGRVPELLSLIFAALTFVVLLRHARLAEHAGIWGLLFLAMPVLSRLPFYLGYPMRVVTGMLAAPLLRMSGLNAVREGTVFRVGEQMIVIDAPCSGTNMLWAAMWVTLTLTALKHVSNRNTIATAALAAIFVIIANAIRSSSLVLAEVKGLELSPTVHSAVGLVSYAGLLGAIGYVVLRLAPASPPQQQHAESPSKIRCASMQWSAFTLACVACAISPLFVPAANATTITDPVWPTTFEGKPLTRVELQPYEKRYAAEFPGRMARFSDGSRQIMFQWLPTHNRAVHSAAQCLKNAGYAVTHGPIIVDEHGVKWSSCTAQRQDIAIRLRERIEDARGRHWQDISSWYWDAILDRAQGPYQICIVTESLPPQ